MMPYPEEGNTEYSYEIHDHEYRGKGKKFLVLTVCFIIVGFISYYLFIGKPIIPMSLQKKANSKTIEIIPSITSFSSGGGSLDICSKRGVCVGGIWTHLPDIKEEMNEMKYEIKNSMFSFTKKEEVDEKMNNIINLWVNNMTLFFPNMTYGIYLYKNITKDERERNEFLMEFYGRSFNSSNASLPEFLKGKYFLMAYHFPQEKDGDIPIEKGDIFDIDVHSLVEKIYSFEINDTNWLFFAPVSQDRYLVSFHLNNSLFFCEINGDTAECILFYKIGVYYPLKYIGSLFYTKNAKGFKEFINRYFPKFEDSENINAIWDYIVRNKIVIYPFHSEERKKLEFKMENTSLISYLGICLKSKRATHKIDNLGLIYYPSVKLFEIGCINSLNEKGKIKAKEWFPKLANAVNMAGSRDKYCWTSMPSDEKYISYSSPFHCLLVSKDKSSVMLTCNNFTGMLKNRFLNKLENCKEKILYTTKLAIANYIKKIIKKKINPDISKMHSMVDTKSKIISKLKSSGVISFNNLKVPDPAHIKFKCNFSWSSFRGEYYVLKDKITISKMEDMTIAVVKKGNLYVGYWISKLPGENKERCIVKTVRFRSDDQNLKQLEEIKFYGVKKGDEYIGVGYFNETLREIEKICNSSSLKSVCMNYLRKLSEMKIIIKVRNGFVTYEKLILPVQGMEYRYEFFVSPTTENEVYQLLASIKQKCKAAQ